MPGGRLFPRFTSALAAFAVALSVAAARADDLLVFAAASTTDALAEATGLFTARSGHSVRTSFAASSALAKQIEQGAPAHLFLSANPEWMDYLAERKLIVPGTRSDLLGNTLVLITAEPGGGPDLKVAPGFDLPAALKGGRLAVGDPDHVPAGIYARQALTSLGVWGALEPRLARTNDVRGAVALVQRGEAPYGIVYATDAASAKNVRVAGTFPAGSHPPVNYPVALVAGRDSAAARALLDFLRGPEARAVFARHGFALR